MGAPLAITRTEMDAAALRRGASRCRDGSAARRMLAIALVVEGKSRAEAAQAAGMDRQSLRDWIVRFNPHGLTGLYARRQGKAGRKGRLLPEQEAELAALVPAGPNPAVEGVVRWRRRALRLVGVHNKA